MATAVVADLAGDICGRELLEINNSYRIPVFAKTTKASMEIWENLPKLECREDDVLLCSFPKSGTHWMFEVLSMIQNRKAERVNLFTRRCLIEEENQKTLESMPSPRTIKTHVHCKDIPQQITEKRVKTILIIRNPKDRAVSFFNQYLSLKDRDYSGRWEDWLPVCMAGDLEYGTYESYLSGWEKAIKEGPGFPLLVVYYENMKKNTKREIQRVMEFLGVEDDGKLRADIEDKVMFQTMKRDLPDEVTNSFMKDIKQFFRKGEVGDWKNWFTVAQNEMFDKVWNERMKTSSLKFEYSVHESTSSNE